MIFIDFDGVILDTAPLLFEELRNNPNRDNITEEEVIEYVKNSNWNYILNNSEVINDSIYYLKQMNPDESFILTKIHSLENEGAEKVKWKNKNNLKQKIILVPYNVSKVDLVDPLNNILIDDCLKNLDEWESKGGNPIFFDYDNDNIDSWHQTNTKGYKRVLNLSRMRDRK